MDTPEGDSHAGRPEPEWDEILARLAEEPALPSAVAHLAHIDEIRARGSQPTDTERLAMVRALRSEGRVSEVEAFYLVARYVMGIAEERIRTDPRLVTLRERMRGGERDRGLAEQQDLIQDEIIVATFREHGEKQLADLFSADRGGFWRRFNDGYRSFYPKEKE